MYAACGTHDTRVEFYFADGYHFSQAERRAIEDLAETTAIEARRVLPALPQHLLIRVYAGKQVIPETGETAEAISPDTVAWTVDPAHEGGVLAVVHTWLRATLFHEFHHLVRYQTVTSTSLMDELVTEGMATVFERDFAGASPPWGMYPDNVMDWVNELVALPPDVDRRYWLTKLHPDGRRWIGMRAGTYLVDRAMKASGGSAADLAPMIMRSRSSLAGTVPSRAWRSIGRSSCATEFTWKNAGMRRRRSTCVWQPFDVSPTKLPMPGSSARSWLRASDA